MIKVENLYKSFGATKILSDVSFSVDSGNISILLGKNGSGKTTLLKCLLGIIKFAEFGKGYAGRVS